MTAWLNQTKRDVATLVEVVNWQHALLDYNAQYNAFLLNQTTEEEFENLSKQIAYEPTNQLPSELAYKIQTVIALTGLDLTSADFASLFRCTKESLDKALDLLNR
jgi:endonuclease/exonuclease/phosphatase (EEP) superfamily protein YafD